MLLGELRAGFPWGVLLVTDDESTDEIPSWKSDEEQVTHSATAAVARVMHQDEGDVTVKGLGRRRFGARCTRVLGDP